MILLAQFGIDFSSAISLKLIQVMVGVLYLVLSEFGIILQVYKSVSELLATTINRFDQSGLRILT